MYFATRRCLGGSLVHLHPQLRTSDFIVALLYREGQWSVLDHDPVRLLGNQPRYEPAFEGPRLHNNAGTYLPADSAELEEMKARLELLLPRD